MFHSFSNTQNMQHADFVFRYLNKTAPWVCHNLNKRIDHQKSIETIDPTLQ